MAAFVGKRKKVDNISVRTITELKKRISLVRSGWFKKALRNDMSYTPSQHDKIKMNINLYLGQMIQFMAGDGQMPYQNALVLDSADLGSSVVLKAFGFQPENIHVPNWFNKTSEYNIMKSRVPKLSCFPISVDDYVQAFTGSEDTDGFRSQLMEKFDNTKWKKEKKKRANGKKVNYKPKIIQPLPERPDGFQFVYLDYCNRFHWKEKRAGNTRYNSDTVKDMFDAECFSKTEPFVFALTGSFMMISKKDYETRLKKFKGIVERAAKKNGYRIRIDQYFVYNRSTQSGEADDVIGYQDEEDIPKDVPSKIAKGSKMFFMSFVGSYNDEAVSEWDSLFSQCGGGACKLEIKHKDCLYQAGNVERGLVFLSKPFCNYKITDFYIVSEVKNRDNRREVLALLDKFKQLPWKKDLSDKGDRADALLAANKRKGKHFANGIIKLFRNKDGGGDNELLDITEMINHVKKGRSGNTLPENVSGKFIFRLDDILDIKFPAETDHSVSIEVIYDDLVGIHFVDDKVLNEKKFIQIKPKIKVNESCFIFRKDDLAKYVVHTETDNSCFKTGQKVMVLWVDGKEYEGVIQSRYDDGDYEVYFESDNTGAKMSGDKMRCIDDGVARKKVKVKRRRVEFTQGEKVDWDGVFGVIEEVRHNKAGEKEYVVYLEDMTDPGWLDDPENIKNFRNSDYISWPDYVYEHHPAYRIVKGSELEKVDEAEEDMDSSSNYSLKF